MHSFLHLYRVLFARANGEGPRLLVLFLPLYMGSRADEKFWRPLFRGRRKGHVMRIRHIEVLVWEMEAVGGREGGSAVLDTRRLGQRVHAACDDEYRP